MSTTIDGSAGVTTNSGAVYNGIQSLTAQNSTSGTAILFTGIPSWAKRVTVMLSGISTNGTSIPQIQLGTSSGPTTTGYVGVVDGETSAGGIAASLTTGLGLIKIGRAHV